jgi:hypothetical protein
MAVQSQMRSNETVGKRLLNVGEAARYLSLEVDTVYKKTTRRTPSRTKAGRLDCGNSPRSRLVGRCGSMSAR